MEVTKGTVTNTTNHQVLVELPELKFRRTWQPNSSLKISTEILEEAVYDVGFKVFLDEGVLFIEDKAIRVQLDLEAEDAEKPFITIFTPAQNTRLIKAADMKDFNEAITTMTKEQALTLVDLAIKEKSVSIEKLAVLKEKTGIDVIKAIELERQNEEVKK